MFVVTLPPSATKNPKAFALRAKRAGADLLEIRGDLTPSIAQFASPLPLIVSPRGTGTKLIELCEPQYVDLEIGEWKKFLEKRSRTMTKHIRGKLILSFHDYNRTPSLSVLKKRVQKMCTMKPWTVKIATMIRYARDLIILEKIQKYLQRKKMRSVVLGMGEKAHLSRALSPLRNAFTYTCLDTASASAPGQLTLKFYTHTHHLKRPKIFGIVGGQQVTRSLSPTMHNALFIGFDIDALYSCFPTEDFRGTMRVLEKLGVVGCSITAPFKRDAFLLANEHDSLSSILGVANTLIRTRRGWASFNTDVVGLREGYPQIRTAKKIVVLGAGGVVPAILLAIGPSLVDREVTVFARDPKKAASTLSQFAIPIKPLSEAKKMVSDCVICCISEDVSLHLPSPLSKKAIAIDLRYGKGTNFQKQASKAGYTVYDGIPMLLYQALAQFQLFTGITPAPSDVSTLHSVLRLHASRNGCAQNREKPSVLSPKS